MVPRGTSCNATLSHILSTRGPTFLVLVFFEEQVTNENMARRRSKSGRSKRRPRSQLRRSPSRKRTSPPRRRRVTTRRYRASESGEVTFKIHGKQTIRRDIQNYNFSTVVLELETDELVGIEQDDMVVVSSGSENRDATVNTIDGKHVTIQMVEPSVDSLIQGFNQLGVDRTTRRQILNRRGGRPSLDDGDDLDFTRPGATNTSSWTNPRYRYTDRSIDLSRQNSNDEST